MNGVGLTKIENGNVMKARWNKLLILKLIILPSSIFKNIDYVSITKFNINIINYCNNYNNN